LTTFYPGPDRWLWPYTVTSSNNTFVVTEDPNGTPSTLTVSITTTANATGEYYVTGDASSSATTDTIYSDDKFTVDVEPIYKRIIDALEAESTANGNGWTYDFFASNAGLTNGGVTLNVDGGGNEIRLDFSDGSFSMDPRIFGFAEDRTSDSSVGGSIASPYTRWGCWQSPDSAHDKRRRESYQTFQSSQQPTAARWRWTRPRVMRRIRYVDVAGAHVWEVDRADRSAEATRAGLNTGDQNNAVKQLFDNATTGRKRVIVRHNDGDGDLGDLTASEIEVVTLTSEFGESFAPQDDETFGHYQGEAYDVHIQAAPMPDLDSYETGHTPYRH